MDAKNIGELGWEDLGCDGLAHLLLLEHGETGFVYANRDGSIKAWSAGAQALTGFEPNEAIGQPLSLIYAPEDRQRGLEQHEMRTAERLGVCENERWHVRKDGSRWWSSGLCFPHRGPDGQLLGFIKIFRDATHLRARMKFLENEVQSQAKAAQAHFDFLGTTAHELRNPLTPLKMALELLSHEPSPSPQHEHALKIMGRQISFLERLVEDLVDLTRVRAGKMSMSFQCTELQPQLREAAEACAEEAQKKGVNLQLVLPPVAIPVELDIARFQQVLANLLNNALKFTPPGGTVSLLGNADQTHFMVYVKDDGQGIAPELLPRIFDVFTQASDAETHRGHGLGIGLSLVKQIVNLHQGTVDVRSEGSGKGSEFSLRIPLRQQDGSQPEAHLEE